MSAQRTHARALPPIAPAILAGLYQHRLLSTPQIHALYTPQAGARWTRRTLSLLAEHGLVDRVRSPRTLSLWFLTEAGADTVESAGPLAEPRRRVTTRAQAEGPLRAHTIAVNHVGIAFVLAARQHNDECSPDSWRHEIAHLISPTHGRRRPGELIVADALLTYLQTTDTSLVLHQRFIELDRGTARPAEQLANKITKYTRLRHYTGGTDTPLWREHYRAFPHLLIVLADQSPQRMQQRIHRTLALHQSDPTNEHDHATIPVSFVTLEDLVQHGPFAPIFISAEHPHTRVDWLGDQPRETLHDSDQHDNQSTRTRRPNARVTRPSQTNER
jgi:hypothetical protein